MGGMACLVSVYLHRETESTLVRTHICWGLNFASINTNLDKYAEHSAERNLHSEF